MIVDMLISTMNKRNSEFIKEMGIDANAIIINQNMEFEDETPYSKKLEGNIQFITVRDKGLTRSRNMAMKYSSGDICMLCDDDLFYFDDYEKKISNAYEEHREADLIIFQVMNSNGEFYKNYANKKTKIKFLKSMKVSSVEISFKRDSLIKSGIEFNEYFGAGSIFTSGEELIFLKDCLKKGLKIIYVPICIGQLRESSSTWFNGYNEQYFISKGASFYATSPKLYIVLIIQFLLRKQKIYNKQTNIRHALKYMLKGKRMYEKIQKFGK